MEVKIIKETKIIVPSELLILNKFDGKLDVKPKNTKITWNYLIMMYLSQVLGLVNVI